MTCHIIEDEPLAASLLQLHVSKLPLLELVAVSNNPVHALDSLKTCPADLLFLDIRMPDMTGLSLLKVLQTRPLVILTTAYSEFAMEGYDLDVVDYLKKPITFERFVVAVEKAERRLQQAGSQKSELSVPDYIFVKEGTRFVKVNIKDILFIEGLKNYVAIHTGSQKIVSLQRLKTLEEQLPNDRFIRVHNSYIVAKTAIASVKENEISVGNARIPVGDTYFKSFMDFIEERHLR